MHTSQAVRRYLRRYRLNLPKEIVDRWVRLGADIEVIDGYPNIYFEPEDLRVSGTWGDELFDNVERLLTDFLLGTNRDYFIVVCPSPIGCFVEEHGGGAVEFLVVDSRTRRPILMGGLEFLNRSGSTEYIDAEVIKITLDTVIPGELKRLY
jgi:hypothetical protein